MSRYRKVDVRMWNDEKFRDLSDDGKMVFIFVMTHPGMTALGAMRASVPGLAAELGWLPERLSEAFAEGLAKGLMEHDERASCVALPNFVKYNLPESPNVVKAWVNSLDMIPECPLKDKTIQRAKGFALGLSEGFRKALPEAFAKAIPKAMPYQEQEQELEPETEQEPSERAYEGREGTYAHARQTDPSKPNPYAEAKGGHVSFQPFPIPSSEAEGQAFLRARGVPDERVGTLIRTLMAGELCPFDIEEYEVRN